MRNNELYWSGLMCIIQYIENSGGIGMYGFTVEGQARSIASVETAGWWTLDPTFISTHLRGI